ncbi:MAG: CGNR zinc finger domain-containing protein [Cyclobacteriaceae bacterium]
MRKYIRTVETLEMDGGWLCLDFINTIRHRYETPQHDYLEGYDQIITWFLRQQLITQEEAVSLRKYNNTPRADEAHQAGITVRETLYQLFLPIIHQNKPELTVVARFNEYVQEACSSFRIIIEARQQVRETWHWEPGQLQQLWYPVIKSAHALLLSDLLGRVKECQACGWLFLDKSKNGSRRWCNMQTCGSSAKSRRYYNKSKDAYD